MRCNCTIVYHDAVPNEPLESKPEGGRVAHSDKKVGNCDELWSMPSKPLTLKSEINEEGSTNGTRFPCPVI